MWNSTAPGLTECTYFKIRLTVKPDDHGAGTWDSDIKMHASGIPEPASCTLLACAAVGIGAMLRGRQKRRVDVVA